MNSEHNVKKDVWDKLWSRHTEVTKEDIYKLIREEKGPVWQAIADRLNQRFGSIAGLRVIEIGAGMGNYSALMARSGAKVTILDYSEKALDKAHSFLGSLGLDAKYLRADALSLPHDLFGSFDVSMSFGLAEHFKGVERIAINKSHLDLLKDNGMTFIAVPNARCLPYRIWKKKRELLGKWQFGLEIPYSRKELRDICDQLGITRCSFLGTPFWAAFDFILPFASWKRSIRKRLFPATWLDPAGIKVPRQSCLDQYLGYLLILVAESYGEYPGRSRRHWRAGH